MSGRVSIYMEGFGHENPIPAASRIGPFLFSGVLVGRDPGSRVMPESLESQCANIFAHVRELMASAGGSTDDIAKMTFYLTDYRDREALNREWIKMFPDPDTRPARHSVAASLDGGALIHCVLIAVMPAAIDSL